MERAMEQLNRLTRSLRRARTVELPDGEPGPGRGVQIARRGRARTPDESGGETLQRVMNSPTPKETNQRVKTPLV